MLAARYMLTLLAATAVFAACAKTLTEGPWFPTESLAVEPADAGTLRAEKDGWVVWTPSGNPVKGKAPNGKPYTAVQVKIGVPDIKFRAFNQFYAEIDNGNAAFGGEVHLAMARPKHEELKNKNPIAAGKSQVEIHFPGVGAPARLLEAKLVVPKDVAPTLAKPVRFRCRMRLTDYNHEKTFAEPIAEALAYEPVSGLTDAERAAAEKPRKMFKAKFDAFDRVIRSSTADMSDKIKAYEGLSIIRDLAPRWIEKGALGAAAANERAKGRFLHGIATGADKVARDDVFCGTMRGRAEVSVARGEAEGVQIVLYPDEPVKSLSWAVSSLADAKGNLLEGAEIRLSPVGYITLSDPAYIPPRQFRETAPDPILEHVKSIDLAAHRFQPFYLDVRATAQSKPGVYTGVAAFRDAAKTIYAKVPLVVTVHAFELPKARTFPMVFSSPTFSPKNPFLRLYAKDDESIRRYGEFLKSDHGKASKEPEDVRRLWNMAYGYHRLLADHNIPTQDIYASVRNVRPAWLRNLMIADSPNWYCLGYDNAGPIVDKVGAHVEPMRSDGVSKAAYLYGFDEIRMSDTRAFQGMKRDYGAVKAAYPEVRTMCTALDGSFGVKSDTEQEVDCWVWPSDGYAGSRKNAERARARGKQVWYYPCNWPYHPHANLHLESLGTGTRVLCGLYAWKYKADGMLYYATAMSKVQTTSRENGFESEKRIEDPKILPGGPLYGPEHCYSMFRSNGDGMLVYPGPDGVLPCLRLKEIRDGVDDYEYLVLLDAAAKKVRAGTVKVSNPRDFLSEAEELLLVTDDLCRGDTRYPETGGPILAWRARVAKLLDATVVAERGRK